MKRFTHRFGRINPSVLTLMVCLSSAQALAEAPLERQSDLHTSAIEEEVLGGEEQSPSRRVRPTPRFQPVDPMHWVGPRFEMALPGVDMTAGEEELLNLGLGYSYYNALWRRYENISARDLWLSSGADLTLTFSPGNKVHGLNALLTGRAGYTGMSRIGVELEGALGVAFDRSSAYPLLRAGLFVGTDWLFGLRGGYIFQYVPGPPSDWLATHLFGVRVQLPLFVYSSK